MKILMINKFLFPHGGSETYIFNIGKQLQSLGYEVQYFGMEHAGRIVGNAAQQYTKEMDFHYGTLLSKAAYPLKTIYSFEASKKLRIVLDDFQPDIVHLNNFNYQLTPSVIVEIRKWEKAADQTCRIVYTAHDYQLVCPNHMFADVNGNICQDCLTGKFQSCLKKKCIHGSRIKSFIGMAEAEYWNRRNIYQEIDAVVCCSEFMKTILDHKSFFKGKTIALHNFVDAEEKTDAEHDDYVLYFGRFAKEKGIETLLKVCARMPDKRFVFAGSGPMEDLIRNQQNVDFRGFVKGDELVSLISHAAVTVYPSEWFENCPFSVIESQIYGTPVIASNIGGIPELIRNHETGILFESGNEEQLFRTITDFFEDKELQERFYENCRNVKFDNCRTYTEKLLEIYKGGM